MKIKMNINMKSKKRNNCIILLNITVLYKLDVIHIVLFCKLFSYSQL